MKVSIIIPFLNVEENIIFLVETLSRYFETEKRFKLEVIFVNDDSIDNSKKK